MTFAKPWEKVNTGKKKVDHTVEAEKARAARKPWNPQPREVGHEELKQHNKQAQRIGAAVRLDEGGALVLARAYALHGDMTLALLQIGRYPADDEGLERARKNAWKYKAHPLFTAAFEAVVMRFTETDILTRDRVLAGLYMEAADRGIATTSSSRVAAWSKLAMLMGMERDVKDPPKADDYSDKSGVLLVPYTATIEDWEQAAMGQQAQLKSDVRT